MIASSRTRELRGWKRLISRGGHRILWSHAGAGQGIRRVEAGEPVDRKVIDDLKRQLKSETVSDLPSNILYALAAPWTAEPVRTGRRESEVSLASSTAKAGPGLYRLNGASLMVNRPPLICQSVTADLMRSNPPRDDLTGKAMAPEAPTSKAI